MPQHWSPEAVPRPRRRKTTTRIVLAASVAAALVGSGIYIANASAAETTVPGRVQAESFAAQSGAQTENTGDADGGKNVGWLANGDWLRYDNVDLGPAGSLTLTARIASDNAAGGSIELHTGTETGALLATFPVARTGGWQKWATVSATAKTHPAGSQTVFAVLKSAQAGDFVNLNWFTFGAAVAASTPAATPATPAPSTSTSAAPAGDGWVNVDKAKWDAQLAEYNALAIRPLPAGKKHDVSEFNASCKASHRLPDDPIVFPGMAGASHMHTFLGNSSTSATSTNESLFVNTDSSCQPAGDHSAYWIPTLYDGDQAIDPDGVTVYYGSNLSGDRSKVVPFPEGFRMIAGNAKLQIPTAQVGGNTFWCAGGAGKIGTSTDGNWPICGDGSHFEYHLSFEECWDGVHLDSPDHKSHVGGRDNSGNCSGKFPVAIPSLGFEISYPTKGSATGMKLSSGMQSSMHGDFMNAWETKPLAERVKNCLTQTVKCNTAGEY